MDCKLSGHYDIIINDINCVSEDQTISPPWNFMSVEFLAKLLSLSYPDSSYVTMNVLYYDAETKGKVMDIFRQVKSKVSSLYFAEIEGWTNKVFMMANDKTAKKIDIKEYQDN